MFILTSPTRVDAPLNTNQPIIKKKGHTYNCKLTRSMYQQEIKIAVNQARYLANYNGHIITKLGLTSHRLGGNRSALSTGDKWQSQTLFLTMFDLHSPMVLTF